MSESEHVGTNPTGYGGESLRTFEKNSLGFVILLHFLRERRQSKVRSDTCTDTNDNLLLRVLLGLLFFLNFAVHEK